LHKYLEIAKPALKLSLGEQQLAAIPERRQNACLCAFCDVCFGVIECSCDFADCPYLISATIKESQLSPFIVVEIERIFYQK
jgi:hypothetical protein